MILLATHMLPIFFGMRYDETLGNRKSGDTHFLFRIGCDVMRQADGDRVLLTPY